MELPAGSARHALASFLEGLRGRNASAGTVTEYRRHATEFLAFLDARGVDWRAPDRATVRAYLSTLADRDLAATSVAGRLAAVRSLYRHALRNGRIETDPLAGVRAPRRPSRLPRVLSVDEAEQLVTAPRRLPSRDEALARRDEAMLELLYATGMRISELAGLTIDRVDLERRRLRVTGKGNKERQLLFGAPAARALRGYLAVARPALAARRRRPPGRLSERKWQAIERPRRSRRDRQVGRRGRGPEPDQPAHAAPFLRHAPARGRRGPARRAGAARSREPGDDADLHAPVGRIAAHRLPRRASSRAAWPERAVRPVKRGRRGPDALGRAAAGARLAGRRRPLDRARPRHRQPDPHRRGPGQPPAGLDQAAGHRLAVRRIRGPRRLFRRLPHPRRDLPARRGRGAVSGAHPRLLELPCPRGGGRGMAAGQQRHQPRPHRARRLQPADGDLRARPRADRGAGLRCADHRADDPDDPRDAGQPGPHRHGRRRDRHPEQLSAVHRAGHRAAALQRRDHRRRHLPGADHGGRGPRRRRRHRLAGTPRCAAPEPGAGGAAL